MFLGALSYSQENLTYQKPPKEILELAEAPLAPLMRMDEKGENLSFYTDLILKVSKNFQKLNCV